MVHMYVGGFKDTFQKTSQIYFVDIYALLVGAKSVRPR